MNTPDDHPLLWQAFHQLNERKRAAFAHASTESSVDTPGDPTGSTRTHGYSTTVEGMRNLMVGFDVQAEHVNALIFYYQQMLRGAVAGGLVETDEAGAVDALVIAGSAWADGLLCGLMLAELRRQRGDDG